MDAGVTAERWLGLGCGLAFDEGFVFRLADFVRCLPEAAAITAFASTPGGSGVPGFQDEDSKGPALRAVGRQPAPGADCFDVGHRHQLAPSSSAAMARSLRRVAPR